MDAILLWELIRIVAYGGLGVLIGYALGALVHDHHQLTAAALNDNGSPPHWFRVPPPHIVRALAAIFVLVVALVAVLVAVAAIGAAGGRAR